MRIITLILALALVTPAFARSPRPSPPPTAEQIARRLEGDRKDIIADIDRRRPDIAALEAWQADPALRALRDRSAELAAQKAKIVALALKWPR